jgi:hypothetical protein
MKDKLISNTHFPMVVGLTALAIALCAAGFSVYGIAMLFGGAALSVAVMAGTLEFGKLVATTYLYRYWTKMGQTLKLYLCSSVVILMVITSLGIFGFLSAAYQKSSLEYGLTQSKIQQVESQKTYHHETIVNANIRIKVLNDVRTAQEARLTEAQTNAFISRNPIQLAQLQTQTAEMIKQANDEIKEKNTAIEAERKALADIDESVANLKIGASEKKDIQTLKYVADQLNWSLDKVAFWFMIAIIFVFDPLAIALILAYNVAVFKKESLEVKENISLPEPPETPTKELILDAEPKKV